MVFCDLLWSVREKSCHIFKQMLDLKLFLDKIFRSLKSGVRNFKTALGAVSNNKAQNQRIYLNYCLCVVHMLTRRYYRLVFIVAALHTCLLMYTYICVCASVCV